MRARRMDHDLALSAHRERVNRVGEARAEERRDPLALEEALHDERLGPIAAVDLGERALGGRLGRRPGKLDHLGPSWHKLAPSMRHPLRRVLYGMPTLMAGQIMVIMAGEVRDRGLLGYR